jgi:hypothetical protein
MIRHKMLYVSLQNIPCNVCNKSNITLTKISWHTLGVHSVNDMLVLQLIEVIEHIINVINIKY